MAAPKEYGLIKRGSKTSVPVIAKPSIFDDSSDEDAGPHSIGKKLQKEADRVQNRKQVKLDISLAISEDPTVFQYDEIYDDLVKKKEEVAVRKKKVDTKPRYIEALLKTSKARKLDQERTYERKVQKEREAEGEKFADKDAFVTSAYKKKMLEMQELDEKDKIEAAIEARNDVTKQTDLRGFYQTLYHQTVGKDAPDSNDIGDSSKGETSKSSSVTFVKEEPKSGSDEEKSNSVNSKEKKPRQWRSRRKNSESSGESDVDRSSRERAKERTRRDRRESSSENKGRTGRRRSDSRERQPTSSKREDRHRSNRGRRSSSSDEKSDKRHNKDGDRSLNRKRRASVSSETSENSVGKRGKRSTSRRESSNAHHANDNKDSSRKDIRDRDKHVNADKALKNVKIKKEDTQETENRGDKNVDNSSGEKPKESAIVKKDPALILEKLKEIFEKRHTGNAFEDARNRFLMRKADRKKQS